VPAQDGIRCEHRTYRLKHLTAEDFALDGQPPTLMVGEDDPALAEFFFEDLVLGAEVLDDFLLLAVAPTGEDGEQELPGLENEVHG
jgi:hypothetical protein